MISHLIASRTCGGLTTVPPLYEAMMWLQFVVSGVWGYAEGRDHLEEWPLYYP